MKYASAFLVTGEIALYFSFTLLFTGVSECFPAMLLFLLLIFLCMILAEMLQKIPVLRAVLLLIPAAAAWFAPHTGLLLVFLPAFLYAFLTAAFGRFEREYWRNVRIAKALFLLGIASAAIFIGRKTASAHGILRIGIFGLFEFVSEAIFLDGLIMVGIFALFQVIGLRMLRIGKGASFRWFLYSLAELLAFPAAAFLAWGIAALVMYGKKIIEILITPVGFLIAAIPAALTGLFSWMKPIEESVEESTSASESAAAETAAAFETTGDAGTFPTLINVHVNWRLVLAVLFIAATAIVLILIFRKRHKKLEESGGNIAGGKFYRSKRKNRRARRPETAAERIRACYREYLELQHQRGLRRVPGDTSLDILLFSQGNASEKGEARLRELYVKARYRGVAEKEEAEEAEQILELIRNAGKVSEKKGTPDYLLPKLF